jgi:cell division protease FtsH
VLVDKPDYKGRIEILKVHAKNVKLSEKADLEEIAKLTAGLAGADLANIINEAALLAGRESQESVNQENLKEAVERVYDWRNRWIRHSHIGCPSTWRQAFLYRRNT